MIQRFVVIAAGVLLAGCAKQLPAVVDFEGTVTLDGKPLPKASVVFVPLLKEFGAESNSMAVSDEAGKFHLVCLLNQQPGAVIGSHVVMVSEAPAPEEIRNAQDGRVVDKYLAGRGNRPIPADYGAFTKTPLKVEVKAGMPAVTLELKR